MTNVLLLTVGSLGNDDLDAKSKMNIYSSSGIDQFRYIKIQPKTMDLSTRLLGINPTNSVFIPTSLVLRSIVLEG